MSFLYIFGTIFLTVYGQLIIKWKMSEAGPLPQTFIAKVIFLTNMMLNPWIISSFTAALIAALCWMAAMTKFDLSYAYPFMSLSFVFVLILSGILFHEPITPLKVIGLGFIIAGIFLGARG